MNWQQKRSKKNKRTFHSEYCSVWIATNTTKLAVTSPSKNTLACILNPRARFTGTSVILHDSGIYKFHRALVPKKIHDKLQNVR